MQQIQLFSITAFRRSRPRYKSIKRVTQLLRKNSADGFSYNPLNIHSESSMKLATTRNYRVLTTRKAQVTSRNFNGPNTTETLPC
jgi:hypothetical protein